MSLAAIIVTRRASDGGQGLTAAAGSSTLLEPGRLSPRMPGARVRAEQVEVYGLSSEPSFEGKPVIRFDRVLTGVLRSSRTIMIMTLLLVGFVAGCGSTPTAPSAPASAPASATASTGTTTAAATAPATTPAAANAVVIKDFAFVPEGLTVAAGATVMVDNQDGANHTLTATDGSFDTGNIPGRAKGMFTAPSTPGSYPYKCAIHPVMTGTLTVT